MLKSYTYKNAIVSQQDPDGAGFFLTNKRGGFVYQKTVLDSRYNGWYIAEDGERVKILESIASAGDIHEIRDLSYGVEVIKTAHTESYMMPTGMNALVITMDTERKATLFFDIRRIFDMQEWNKHYTISVNKDAIIVEFVKKDQYTGRDDLKMFVVIGGEFHQPVVRDNWQQRHYALDEQRKSTPYVWYVYEGLQVSARQLICTAAHSLQQAMKEFMYVKKNLPLMMEREKERAEALQKNISVNNVEPFINTVNKKDVRTARRAAEISVASLVMDGGESPFVYAGLPWFSEYWTRDTLVSWNAIQAVNPVFAKHILLQFLDGIQSNGLLPNLMSVPTVTNRDSIGWLFLRLGQSIDHQRYADDELKRIVGKLERSLGILEKDFLRDRLFVCRRQDTWMDSLTNEQGAYIEIQALMRQMYELAYRLTKHPAWREKSVALREAIREQFVHEGIIYDDAAHQHIRQNAFLAYYIDPELFSAEEWEALFAGILPKLFCVWGGISSLDHTAPNFHAAYSGEDAQSYHNGDSWFYLNNIAALALFQVNAERFAETISAILAASTKDILWGGIMGGGSEISSAGAYDPQGCLVQLWSAALYRELVDALLAI